MIKLAKIKTIFRKENGNIVPKEVLDEELNNNSVDTIHINDGAITRNKLESDIVDSIDNAMSKTNPTGTGSFSLNRKSGTTSGTNSFAEGTNTTASGGSSHAEGYNTKATGDFSHVEGSNNTASGTASHAEGYNTTASGIFSHAEGDETVASGDCSHAEGFETTAASNHQHVQGIYNIEDSDGEYAHIVGNGSSENNRSNAHTLDWNGNAWFAGNITVVGNIEDGTGNVLSDKVDKVTGKGLSTNDYTNDEKEKLSSIESGAEVNIIESLQFNGTPLSINNKTVDLSGIIDISDKMDKTNPTGTGSFSLNRKSGTTSGTNSFAEGTNTTASGESSHAEGSNTIASGGFSHAEGSNNTASGAGSHAEGYQTTTSAQASHAEGWNTKATGECSHAEGRQTFTSHQGSHAEGCETSAIGVGSHVEGYSFTRLDFNDNNIQTIINSATDTNNPDFSSLISYWDEEDANNTLIHKFSLALGHASHVEGRNCLALVQASHAEGNETLASGLASHSEGDYAFATNTASHAEGGSTQSSGIASHAEGSQTTAFGNSSHSEGKSDGRALDRTTETKITDAINENSSALIADWDRKDPDDPDEAINKFSLAGGEGSHVEGSNCLALGKNSHAEGNGTIAEKSSAHAEGTGSHASGKYSHAEGSNTIAAGVNQHVEGTYNIKDNNNTYAHIVGNGTADNARSNAMTLDWSGNAWFAGNITDGAGNVLSQKADKNTLIKLKNMVLNGADTNGGITEFDIKDKIADFSLDNYIVSVLLQNNAPSGYVQHFFNPVFENEYYASRYYYSVTNNGIFKIRNNLNSQETEDITLLITPIKTEIIDYSNNNNE